MKIILVVDDSTSNLKLVENALKDYYKLILVKSGQKALQYLSNNHVDLVLLDIMMPEMDGFQTFEHIKALDLNREVPVVFITADVDVKSEIRGLEMGAMDFIRKPFVPAVMLNRINNIMRLDELTKSLEDKVKEKTKQIAQLSFEKISTIASMIEAKDSYTKGHSVRVAEYSSLLAKKLGWKDDDVQNLKYIALLHDIGKVGIPDNVLNKPDKLNEDEINIIRLHTTIGGDILKDIESIADVDSGAKYHHERYDGNGYPCGLQGEHIPEVARIICVADAYDAMNTWRVYRKELPDKTIREELLAGRGSQFDPNILDAFMELLDEGNLDIDFNKVGEDKTLSGESSALIHQIMKSIEEEAKRGESLDHLTGLLGRKEGERQIEQAMKEKSGYLAFIDLDNLKRTNDTMGHLAGDYAIQTVGEVLIANTDGAIVTRLGGDEFLYYMKDVDKEEATRRIEKIMAEFDQRKSESPYLSVSTLSVGICETTIADSYHAILKRADRALYHVKQSGKSGYFFYVRGANNNGQHASVDLDKLVCDMRKQGSYSGAMSVEFREFAKIYDFMQHLGERYEYDIQLMMITLNSNGRDRLYIDEREHAMTCMEKTIQASLRTVDISTRFSGKQFIVILLNARSKDIELVTNRILDNFYKIYDKKLIEVKFDVAELQI